MYTPLTPLLLACTFTITHTLALALPAPAPVPALAPVPATIPSPARVEAPVEIPPRGSPLDVFSGGLGGRLGGIGELEDVGGILSPSSGSLSFLPELAKELPGSSTPASLLGRYYIRSPSLSPEHPPAGPDLVHPLSAAAVQRRARFMKRMVALREVSETA